MKQFSNALVWALLIFMSAFIVLNWSVMMTSATLDFVVVQVQAPVGVVMLGACAVLVALFFVAYLQNQISSLLETRRLLKEIQRVQELADKAEASRIENLQQLMATEFRLLHERLDNGKAPLSEPPVPREDRPSAGLMSSLLPPAI